jgi:threonine/homoserine/homoserine lactone efflux protein
MENSTSVLAGVAVIWVVAVLSPGPAFMVIVQAALSKGRAVALKTVTGLACGTMLWGIAGFFGVSVIFAAAPWAYLALKVIGGGYLIYLGVRVFAGNRNEKRDRGLTPDASINAWRRGFVTNLTNPKAAAFVASVYATTMPPNPSVSLGIAAVATMVSITTCWYSVVAFGLTTGRMTALCQRGRAWLERATGIFLIVFGIKMIADR